MYKITLFISQLYLTFVFKKTGSTHTPVKEVLFPLRFSVSIRARGWVNEINSHINSSDPFINEFITLCQKIDEPVPRNEVAISIPPMPNHFSRHMRTLTFLPDHFQNLSGDNFGQMPTKNTSAILSSKAENFNNNGQSILLSLAIVLCLAGLLYILIYFTS